MPNDFPLIGGVDDFGRTELPKELPKVKTREEAMALEPGAEFIAPDGSTKIRPYEPKSIEEVKNIPEGAHFIAPDGSLKQNPKYDPISFTSQTLYDMAVNDAEREKALARSYGKQNVKRDMFGEMYVEDNGMMRKPSHGLSRVTGAIAAQAAPVGGAVLGAIGGSPSVAGAAAGGAGGALLGQSFNDMIMGLAGVYSRTRGEEAAELGIAAAGGAAGAGVGGGISKIAPVAGARYIAPWLVNKALGAEKGPPGALTEARALAEKGAAPPPSMWAKEGAHVVNMAEIYEPAFHLQKPILQQNTKYYQDSAAQILKTLGVDVPKSEIISPTAKISAREAGAAALKDVRERVIAADEHLHVALQNAEPTQLKKLEATVAHETRLQELRQAQEQSKAAVEQALNAGYGTIRTEIRQAMEAAGAGHNSGDLWFAVGEKLRTVRQGIQERANKMYNEADMLAGDVRPDMSELPNVAEQVLKQMPKSFEDEYPSVVEKIRGLAKKEETGQPPQNIGDKFWAKSKVGESVTEQADLWTIEQIKPDGSAVAVAPGLGRMRVTAEQLAKYTGISELKPTFGQLRNMRSAIRNSINWWKLDSDFKNGTLKLFANKVDNVLHDVNAAPELRAAAESLDRADAFYAEQMKVFNDHSLNAVTRGLESGEPADPKKLYDTLIKEGRTDLANKVKTIVGPNLWGAIRSADLQSLLDESKALVPGQIDGNRFIRGVLERERANMLGVIHGDQVRERLLRQAQYIAQKDGKLDVPQQAGDTISTLIDRMHQATKAVEEAAKIDPIALLEREAKSQQGILKKLLAQREATRKEDPLGFLLEPTMGEAEAADKILGSEDLLLAANQHFGEKSHVMELMRQVWAKRLLMGGLEPGKRLEKISPEIQQIMMPGVTYNQAKLLASEMANLMSSRGFRDPAKSIAAQTRLENPWGTIGTAGLKYVPGSNYIGRTILGSYYGFIRWGATNPGFLRWLEKGLNNPETREAFRDMLRERMSRFAPAGAAIGESLAQQPGSETPKRSSRGRSQQAQRATDDDVFGIIKEGQLGEISQPTSREFSERIGEKDIPAAKTEYRWPGALGMHHSTPRTTILDEVAPFLQSTKGMSDEEAQGGLATEAGAGPKGGDIKKYDTRHKEFEKQYDLAKDELGFKLRHQATEKYREDERKKRDRRTGR